MKTTTKLGLAVIALTTLMTAPLKAADAGQLEGTQEGVPYVRIVAEPNGESHFEEGVLPFSFMNLPSGEVAGMHNVDTAGRATYMMFPSGVFEEFHATPNSQLLIVVQGEVEVGTSDGDKRQFKPGDVVMMDDNTGKGHTTRTFGAVPHIALMMPKQSQ